MNCSGVWKALVRPLLKTSLSRRDLGVLSKAVEGANQGSSISPGKGFLLDPHGCADVPIQNVKYALEQFSSPARLIRNVSTEQEIPAGSDLPEIAFAGRSNVGKSTLLNALLQRRSLAAVSKRPGCTQELGFYGLGHNIIFVDMPGYGYAEAPKKHVKSWNLLIGSYLSKRPTLKRVFVLVDAAIGVKQIDLEFMELLNYEGVSHQIVLTKIDRLQPQQITEVSDAVFKTASQPGLCLPVLYGVSAKKGWGLHDLKIMIIEASGIQYTRGKVPGLKEELKAERLAKQAVAREHARLSELPVDYAAEVEEEAEVMDWSQELERMEVEAEAFKRNMKEEMMEKAKAKEERRRNSEGQKRPKRQEGKGDAAEGGRNVDEAEDLQPQTPEDPFDIEEMSVGRLPPSPSGR